MRNERKADDGIIGRLAKGLRLAIGGKSRADTTSIAPANPDPNEVSPPQASPTATDLINEGLRQRQRLGTAAALPFFERAAKLEPNFHLPALMLGNAATELGDLDSAVAHYLRARDIRPNDHLIRYNLGLTQIWRGYGDAAIEELDAARRIDPSYLAARTAYLLALHNSDRVGSGDLAAAIREIGALYGEQRPANLETAQSARTEKLRVGFVSGDFRTHSVAHFFEPILNARQRDAFDYLCYSTCSQSDAVTERLRADADAWRDVWKLDDDALADQIRNDRIDILVDLSGHTEFNRLPLFARRAAPVQITYLGFPNSTGVAAMDYRITDAVTDPGAVADELHAEKLLRLPDSQWCFRPFGTRLPPSPLPALENGFVTFGSFNNLIKSSDTLLDCWKQILLKVPNSRLRITRVRSPQRAAEIVSQFARSGIVSERIECIAYKKAVPHGLQFTGVDIALDPFPYNGVTTTCETLHSGVPVVSMYGASCVSRSGLSILGSAGLGELAASSPSQYVEIAAALGLDLVRLDRLRSGLRARFDQSPLRDERRFAANFEELLRRAWKQHRGEG
jgi:predicted O-linked N-acetylglucosamine transferase (SPINDLY family)